MPSVPNSSLSKLMNSLRFSLAALLLLAGCGGGGITMVGLTPTLSTIYTAGQTVYVDGGRMALNYTVPVKD